MSTPVAPPEPPAGNFTNPAFFLAVIPQIAAVASIFNKHIGLSLTGNEQGLALLGAALVSLGAYVARAAKHNAHGTAMASWYQYLSAIGAVAADFEHVVDPGSAVAATGTDVPPPLPPLTSSGVDLALVRTGTVRTTRVAAKKAAAKRATARSRS